MGTRNPKDLNISFGDYILIDRIGSGGMATIYKAKILGERGFQKVVAIKIIHAHLTEDEKFVQQFINEAHLGAKLSHPNIIQIYHFSQVQGEYFIAMEFVEGISLDRIIESHRRNRTPIPLGIILQICIQICDGLHYAHTSVDEDGNPIKLIHRDLKPSNILIDKWGMVKIADFGVAKAAISPYQTATAGTIKGTVAYMSPEQLSGHYDPRGDIFSAAAIFYEMITLKRLFPGDNLLSIVKQVETVDIPRVVEPIKEVFPGIDLILKKGLHRDLEKRYQTAREMGEALRESLRSIEISQSIAQYMEATLLSLHLKKEPERVERKGEEEEKGGEGVTVAREAGVEMEEAPPPEEAPRIEKTPPAVEIPERGEAPPPLPEPEPEPEAEEARKTVSLKRGEAPRRRPLLYIAPILLVVAVSAGIFLLQGRGEKGELVQDAFPEKGGVEKVTESRVTPADFAKIEVPGGPIPEKVEKGMETTGSPAVGGQEDRKVSPPAATPINKGREAPPAAPASGEPEKVTGKGVEEEKMARSTPVADEPSKVTKKPPPPPPPAGGEGYITLNTLPPAAKIYINGKPYKTTPVGRLKLPAGWYRVKLVDSSSSKSVTFSIRIRNGLEKKAIYNFNTGSWLKKP